MKLDRTAFFRSSVVLRQRQIHGSLNTKHNYETQ